MSAVKTLLPLAAALEVGGLAAVQTNLNTAVSFSAASTIITVLVSVVVSYTVLRVTVSFVEKDMASLHKSLESVRESLTSLGREVSELRGRIATPHAHDKPHT